MEPEPLLICPPPLSVIWKNETDTLIQAISEGLSGKYKNIAILSEYEAGREDIVSVIECIYPKRVMKITLDSFITDLPLKLQTSDTEIVILENCQYLARRTIHGFHLLHRFIEVLLQKEKIWVTTWNIHSWRYLCAVAGIEPLFPIQIPLTHKSTDVLKEFILSQHTSPTSYIINAPVPRRLIAEKRNKKIEIPFLNVTYSLDYIGIRFALLWAILRGKSNEVDPDELIFLRLAQISDGNPGIALKIWKKVQTTWEIRMSSLSPPIIPALSDPDTAYVVSQVISLENPLVTDLVSILPQDIKGELILGYLIENNLLYLETNRIFIEPLALAGITYEMKRMRKVW